MKQQLLFTSFLFFIFLTCPNRSGFSQGQNDEDFFKDIYPKDIKVGAERKEVYYPWLENKNVAIVANQTSIVENKHLTDILLADNIKLVKIFCSEHGFRGTEEAGESINNNIDSKTGLPVVSIYGDKKKPSAEDLKNVDIVLFDMQDVGVRFYTYVSTMHYVMQACAENNVQMIILDRPNPNGYYIDGPVLEPKFKSFIGMHNVPLVHGLTLAEFACMINGEGWLGNDLVCNLKYVTVESYKHNLLYQLPVKPSPNLASMESTYLYPSLGLFEGTVISVGRGTLNPFEIFGRPKLTKNINYEFMPTAIKGMSTSPKFLNTKCYGYELANFCNIYIKHFRKLYLFWILETYNDFDDKEHFFLPSFDKLAGTDKLRNMIIEGKTEENIRNSWKNDIEKYKIIRKKYLLYPDFE